MHIINLRLYRALFAGSLFIGLFVVVPLGHAQPQKMIFDHYTTDDGMGNSSTFEILQDRQGFMWFGTVSFVSKFDGYSFTNYGSTPGDTTSFPGGTAVALLEGRDGLIWVGSARGLSRLDPQTGTFTRYDNLPSDTARVLQQNVNELVEDQDGVLWVGTATGLFSFDPDTKSVTPYLQDPQDPSNSLVTLVSSLVQDKAGFLWIGTADGVLNRFDPKTNTVVTYTHDPLDPNSLPGLWISDLHFDQNGTLWVSSLGLSRYDPASDSFTNFYPDPENLAFDPENPPFSNFIRGFCEDDSGNLWAGTRMGLLHFDLETETFTAFKRDPDDPGSLNEDWVESVFQDSFGALWVGTRFIGLNRADLAATLIPHYIPVPSAPEDSRNYIQGILEDQKGNVWVGNMGGVLERTNLADDTVREYRHDPSNPGSLSRGNAQTILEDASGAIWIGTGLQYVRGSPGGLSRYDPVTDTFSRILFDPDEPTMQVLTLAESPSKPGILWIGTDIGLYRYDTKTRTASHYQLDPANPYSLNNNVVNSLHEDRSGTLWIGTYIGLNRMNRPHEALMADAETEVFTRLLPFAAENEIVAIYEDQKLPGILWLASKGGGGGLIRFDKDTEQFSFFTEANSGIANNIIYGILGDADGNLWLSTQGGLSRFNPETGQVKNYGIPQGLMSREFNTGSFHKGHSGTLYFGSVKGYNAFKPEEIGDNPFVPRMVITDLKLFNKSLIPSADGVLRAPISVTASLTLAHDQNDVTFEYVGLHFSNSEKIQYAYWLENYDDTWRHVNTQRTATYTNLDPGTYIFHVKAANSDGVWNEEGTSLVLTILPPWWRSWWAYGIYGMLLFGGIVSGDRVQRKRVIAQQKKSSMERELEQAKEIEKAYRQLKTTQTQLVQAEKMASLGQLTAGIAHEIKNPLNFINNFAEVNEDLAKEIREAVASGESFEDLLDDLERNAAVIAQHGKRADGIVHAMMQHASGGSTERIKTDINQLVSEHIDLAYHGKRAKLPDLLVDIKRDLAADIGEVTIVPQEIGRVLLNLLGNAFDAVHAHALSVNSPYKPSVTVSTHQVDGGIEIRVVDNGPGIPSEIKDRIFEPFFTTKPTGEGTGLGLSLSYDIVTQGHGGMLTVESEEGTGATFVLSLPAGTNVSDS